MRGLFNIGNRNCTRTARLGNKHPNQATVIKIRHGIDQEIGKIFFFSVFRAPPHDCSVNDIFIVGIN